MPRQTAAECCFFAFDGVCCIERGLLEGKACDTTDCDDYSPDEDLPLIGEVNHA